MLSLRILGLAVILLTGCASKPGFHSIPFDFSKDTFDFANELYWVYDSDPKTGKQVHHKTEPPPSYAHHCFVVARSARQFFDSAVFRSELPRVSEREYRKIIHNISKANPRHHLTKKIIVPGYAHLRQFSEAHENLLKEECGGAWQSYFQRGHWRMVMPFSRRHQSKTAEGFSNSLSRNCPPVAHLIKFPQLTINHAVLVIGATTNKEEVVFSIYDPNSPEKPGELKYDATSRSFSFPETFYFKGGKVNVYEHYQSILN